MPAIMHKAGCTPATKDVGPLVGLGTAECPCEMEGSPCPSPFDPPTVEVCLGQPCAGDSLIVASCEPFGPGVLVDFQLGWHNAGGADALIYFEILGSAPRWYDVHDGTGSGTVLVESIYFDEAGLYDYGRIDKRKSIEIEEGMKYFVNIGSVGQPRDGDWRACYAIYDIPKKMVTFRRVEYDKEATKEKILAAGLPPGLASRLDEGR